MSSDAADRDLEGAAKRAYVRAMRLARAPLSRIGVLRALEHRSHRRGALWARSLFAVHDVDDMVALDIPWWSLSAVERVDAFLRDLEGARVFEYGSGASTVWLAKRAKSVVSVEHDEPWADRVRNLLRELDNVELRVVPPDEPRRRGAERDETDRATTPTVGGSPRPPAADRYRSGKSGWRNRTFEAYVDEIETAGGPFDLVVVDGRARSACFEAAQRHLEPGGMIVFDNSDRERYRAAIASSPLWSERHGGLTACLPYVDPTTLFRAPPP